MHFNQMMRVSRQPATLSENLDQSNPHWSRAEDCKWVCCIDGCGRAFARKGLLVFHRGHVHLLNEYERNIPDQRVKISSLSSSIGSCFLAFNCGIIPSVLTSIIPVLILQLSFLNGSRIGASQAGIEWRTNSQLVELSSGEILDICARAIPERGSVAENTGLFFEGVTILLERLFQEDTGAPQPRETQVLEEAFESVPVSIY